MPKLVLHIGAPKTGTSALQSAFARNVDALRDQGFIYPELPNSDIAKRGHVTSGNGVGLAKFLNSGISYDGGAEPIEERLDQAAQSAMSLLYSSEVMATFRPQSMRALRELAAKRGMTIHVVVYVRAPVDHAVSAYRQFVKSGYTESLENFVSVDYKLPFKPIIKRLGESLEPNEISVRNYDTVSDGLFQDFLSGILNITDFSTFDNPVVKVNRSLTGAEISVLRTINKAMDDSRLSTKIGRILVNGDPGSSYRLRASAQVLKVMEERYDEDLQITNELLGGEPLQMCRKVEIVEEVDERLSDAERTLAFLIGTLFKQTSLAGTPFKQSSVGPRQAPGAQRDGGRSSDAEG